MTVQLSVGSGIGGVVQGGFGTYPVDSHGFVTVNPGDVPPLLAKGMTFIRTVNNFYTTPAAPAAASAAVMINSAALSNGALAVAAQPGVMRQAALIIGAGTTALSAGTVALVYIGNDGTTYTETLSAVCAASATITQFLSKGVAHLTSATVAGVAGGASPFVQLGTTAVLSVPISPNAESFAVSMEATSGVPNAVGTVDTNTAGSISPTNAPNATRTYAFQYTYVAP